MRAFIWALGGMAALVVALFLWAGGAPPLPPLEPRLAAGETLTQHDAGRAFDAWLAELPVGIVAPMRVRYACEFRSAEPDGAPRSFTFDVTFVDARRGRFVVQVPAHEGGGALELGLLADGTRWVVWVNQDDAGAALGTRMAYALDQGLGEQIWSQLRENAAPLLQLAQLGDFQAGAELPQHPLEFLHPAAWTRNALRTWDCERLALAGEVLHADLRASQDAAESFGSFAGLFTRALEMPIPHFEVATALQRVGLTMELDARSGAWLALQVRDAAGDGTPALALRSTDFARRASADELRLPAGLQPEDVTARARALLPFLQAAAGAAGSATPREF